MGLAAGEEGSTMHIPLDLAIREQLNEYLIGNLTLDDFKDWLVGVS